MNDKNEYILDEKQYFDDEVDDEVNIMEMDKILNELNENNEEYEKVIGSQTK